MNFKSLSHNPRVGAVPQETLQAESRHTSRETTFSSAYRGFEAINQMCHFWQRFAKQAMLPDASDKTARSGSCP